MVIYLNGMLIVYTLQNVGSYNGDRLNGGVTVLFIPFKMWAATTQCGATDSLGKLFIPFKMWAATTSWQ